MAITILILLKVFTIIILNFVMKEICIDVQGIKVDSPTVYQEGKFSKAREDLEAIKKFYEEVEIETTDREVQKKEEPS